MTSIVTVNHHAGYPDILVCAGEVLPEPIGGPRNLACSTTRKAAWCYRKLAQKWGGVADHIFVVGGPLPAASMTALQRHLSHARARVWHLDDEDQLDWDALPDRPDFFNPPSWDDEGWRLWCSAVAAVQKHEGPPVFHPPPLGPRLTAYDLLNG